MVNIPRGWVERMKSLSRLLRREYSYTSRCDRQISDHVE